MMLFLFLSVCASTSYSAAIGFPEPKTNKASEVSGAVESSTTDSVGSSTSKANKKVIGFPSQVADEAIHVPNSDKLFSFSGITGRLGFGTKISRVSLSDDIGKTNNSNSTRALSLYYTDAIHDNVRYLFESFLSSYVFEADATHVGQALSQQGFRFSVQTRVVKTKKIMPWLGAGIALSRSNARKRHIVDDEGFLVTSYSDKTKPSLSVIFNIMQKWPINSGIDIAAKLEYSKPMTQSVGGVSLGLILFFQPTLW